MFHSDDDHNDHDDRVRAPPLQSESQSVQPGFSCNNVNLDFNMRFVQHMAPDQLLLTLHTSVPMPPRLVHAPGRSDDTEAHTSTALGASRAGGDSTCTTSGDPV